MEKSLKQQAKELLKRQQALAFFYLPGQAEAQLIAGSTKAHKELPKDISSLSGFVFAPYHASDSQPIYVINNDNMLINSTINKHQNSFKDNYHLSQEGYKNIVQKGVKAIDESDTLSKVVLSRSMEVQLSPNFDVTTLLASIKKAMPKAFCYLVNIPGQGTWLGATPEKLLEIDDKEAYTHSIAGTLPADSTQEWREKEIDEQQIVSDYIAQHLESIGITDYQVEGPSTVSSGSVRHLKTSFHFSINAKEQMRNLINTLHPTPAICGMPQQEADELISQLEKQSREYYTGYLGPIGIQNVSHIFVNLRCMKVCGSCAKLYVGAGITAGSIPQKEWDETEVKALTLLNVIQQP